MGKISDLTRSKKALCNPPVRALLNPEPAAKIDSAEQFMDLGFMNEPEVVKLIEADEDYLRDREKCDAEWLKRYERVLAIAYDRLEEANASEQEEE